MENKRIVWSLGLVIYIFLTDEKKQEIHCMCMLSRLTAIIPSGHIVHTLQVFSIECNHSIIV